MTSRCFKGLVSSTDFGPLCREHGGKSSKRKARDQKVAGLKAQLYDLLSRPLIASGVSTRYITSGSKPIAEDLLEGNCKSYAFFDGFASWELIFDVGSP